MIKIDKEKDIIVIFGATASGKSQKAIEIAEKIDGVIINADSVQVYKDAPILSNIPTLEERKQIPHKLFAFLNLQEQYSVGKWLLHVKKEVEAIKKDNKIPIIVGGSGLYISSMINGISSIPSSNQYKVEGEKIYEEVGKENFLKLIASFDKEITLKFQDKQRLIRAYEVFKFSGDTLSYYQKKPRKKIIPYNFLNYYIAKNKEELYENINIRFNKMVKKGAIEEVENILKITKEKKILKKILGLFEISLFVNGSLSKEEAISLAKQKTRNYAKRQTTWFNNQIENKKYL